MDNRAILTIYRESMEQNESDFRCNNAEDYFTSQYLKLKDNGNKKILYLHTPFCQSKCSYCVCHSRVGNLTEINDYVNNGLAKQIIHFQELLGEITFDEVYLGGGTPSIISASEWEKLFSLIPNFKSIKVKSMECSPSSVTMEHLEMLKKYGFSYVSFGIQSINRNNCKKYNRPYVNRDEIKYLSSVLKEYGLYYNFDLICYMGYGDIRDLVEFGEELDFLMKECKPSSIVCHQLYQQHFSEEKTRELMRLLRTKIEKYPEYECINAELNDEDAFNDTLYQAEYRLIKENRKFRHYMWNKYPTLPMVGYDVFAIGYLKNMSIKSNVEDLLYLPIKQEVRQVKLNTFFDEDERRIRKIKGL